MKIRFSSAIAAAVRGEAEATLDFEGDVAALLALLSQKYGEGFQKRILSGGRINGFVSVYLNGEDIRFLKDVQTRVRNGDTIYITPAVSGG
ncbi:MAG: MoaD/ThiS family protein [Candidatus Micrarchaeia archaeon]